MTIHVAEQLDLALPLPVLAGQQAASLLDAGTRHRLSTRYPQPVCLMGRTTADLMTWGGRGQKPGWVKEWEANGGTRQQLEARL